MRKLGLVCSLLAIVLGSVPLICGQIVPPTPARITPATLTGKVGEAIILRADTTSDVTFAWQPNDGIKVNQEGGKFLVIVASKEGTYIISTGALRDKVVVVEQTTVTIEKSAPQPKPIPTPPVIDDKRFKVLEEKIDALVVSMLQAQTDILILKNEPKPPGPKPVPPDPPKPPPSPSPIPVAGLRMLIVEDKLQLSSLPPAQLSIRTSKLFRDYLDANCATEEDGKTKAYRIWDHKTVVTGDYKYWQDAMQRPRSHSYTDAAGKAVHVSNYLPWIIVSNYPSGGYEGPLPNNTEETIQLLQKIKGN